MPTDPQTVQLLAVVAIFMLFAVAEIAIDQFFAPAASREDNRLDVAVGLLVPVISGGGFAAARALCAVCQ